MCLRIRRLGVRFPPGAPGKSARKSRYNSDLRASFLVSNSGTVWLPWDAFRTGSPHESLAAFSAKRPTTCLRCRGSAAFPKPESRLASLSRVQGDTAGSTSSFCQPTPPGSIGSNVNSTHLKTNVLTHCNYESFDQIRRAIGEFLRGRSKRSSNYFLWTGTGTSTATQCRVKEFGLHAFACSIAYAAVYER